MSQTRRTFVAGAAAFSFAAGRAPAFAQQRLTPIRIVVTPVTNYTGLLVGRDKGWFEEQGLNVSWSPVAQTAIAVEATYGGSVEFAGGGVLEPMIARGNGLDMMLVVPSARIRPEAPDNSAIVVKANSAIQKPADLAGKRASVGLLNSINHIHFIEWMRRNGGDAKTVQLTEIPFPQMADALMQDRLDAVWAVEPFFTILKKSGNVRVIGYPYQENIPNMDVTAMFAKESWLKANADAAKRFRTVFTRAQKFMTEAPKADRDAFVSKFTSVRPELVAEMSLPIFVSDFNVQSLKTNMELAVSQKLMKSIDVESMVWKG
jgi:NitT/TauT family transport system substrate-binding protein